MCQRRPAESPRPGRLRFDRLGGAEVGTSRGAVESPLLLFFSLALPLQFLLALLTGVRVLWQDGSLRLPEWG